MVHGWIIMGGIKGKDDIKIILKLISIPWLIQISGVNILAKIFTIVRLIASFDTNVILDTELVSNNVSVHSI